MNLEKALYKAINDINNSMRSTSLEQCRDYLKYVVADLENIVSDMENLERAPFIPNQTLAPELVKNVLSQNLILWIKEQEWK